MEEAMTFHNWKQNELEYVIKNIEPRDKQPIRNNPPELWHIKIELETSRELIWDYIENQNQAFWDHEIIVPSPHIRENDYCMCCVLVLAFLFHDLDLGN